MNAHSDEEVPETEQDLLPQVIALIDTVGPPLPCPRKNPSAHEFFLTTWGRDRLLIEFDCAGGRSACTRRRSGL
jgi:hypothetical protein